MNQSTGDFGAVKLLGMILQWWVHAITLKTKTKTKQNSVSSTLHTPNVCGVFPHQPILQLPRHQMGVPQLNSDTNYPELV